jgi:hypothetical protein
LRGGEEEAFELLGAFAVAPIADPDEALALALFLRRVEAAEVGGLVPRPDAVVPAPAAVDFAQRFAERQHTVIAGEVVRLHRLRFADGAVMRVVEQERVTCAALALLAERGDQGVVVPLVDDDEIGAVG